MLCPASCRIVVHDGAWFAALPKSIAQSGPTLLRLEADAESSSFIDPIPPVKHSTRVPLTDARMQSS